MYSIKKTVPYSFQDTVSKVTAELKKEGFGVLTEIDVKATLKEKLDVDYDNYIILGACNPPFSHRALEAEKDIGLLLPCNVIVHSHESKTYVAAVNPAQAMSMVSNTELKEIAKEIEKKLRKVIASV